MPPCSGPFLGVDYGFERAGIAISDAAGLLAWPLAVLELQKFHTRKLLLDELARLALDNGCKGIVIGLPLHVDGTENNMCASIRKVAARIGRRCGLPLFFMPETLSTEEARANLLASGLRGKELKAALDQEAARIILQAWLENGRGREAGK